MASSVTFSSVLVPLSHEKSCVKLPPSQKCPFLIHNKQVLFFNLKSSSAAFRTSFSSRIRVSSNGPFDMIQENETSVQQLPSFEQPPVKFLFWVFLWAYVSFACYAVSGDANAATTGVVDCIRGSCIGLKFATALRSLGWPDEAVVFALATLPVIELRGAIPVGYLLQLKPLLLTALSISGNMLPVPFIILYLKKFATFLAGRNGSVSRFLDMMFESAKNKASPVEEFQWLGLMLFVAVPFPGTGAWTGAIIASVLDMPFWPAVSANFFGVVLAGLLVNLLMNLGLKYAVMTGIILFITSSFMWKILQNLKRSWSKSN